jgi:hypothetical protein
MVSVRKRVHFSWACEYTKLPFSLRVLKKINQTDFFFIQTATNEYQKIRKLSFGLDNKLFKKF